MVESSKTEKTTSLWMGLFILTLSVIYILVTLGKVEWVQVIAILVGIFLAGFLFIQAGVFGYFRKKDYRKIGMGDFIVWFTLIIAVGVLLNSLLLIGIINNSTPVWLISFAQTSGTITGVSGGILAIVHIFFPRFK